VTTYQIVLTGRSDKKKRGGGGISMGNCYVFENNY
jgi:hypothetical protein